MTLDTAALVEAATHLCNSVKALVDAVEVGVCTPDEGLLAVDCMIEIVETAKAEDAGPQAEIYEPILELCYVAKKHIVSKLYPTSDTLN